MLLLAGTSIARRRTKGRERRQGLPWSGRTRSPWVLRALQPFKTIPKFFPKSLKRLSFPLGGGGIDSTRLSAMASQTACVRKTVHSNESSTTPKLKHHECGIASRAWQDSTFSHQLRSKIFVPPEFRSLWLLLGSCSRSGWAVKVDCC